MDPRYAELKNFKQIYEKEGPYHHTARGFSLWFLQDNYKAISEECKNSHTILDLACGEGCLSTYLTGKHLVGVDYSEKALQFNRQLFPGSYVELLYGDLRESNSADLFEDKFDAVVCSLSLMYFITEDLQRVFVTVRNLLKRQGKFVFTYPTVSRYREANPTASELPLYKIFGKLVDNGFRSISMYPICPIVPSEIVSKSKAGEEETVSDAKRFYEQAKREMTLQNSYHYLCRAEIP